MSNIAMPSDNGNVVPGQRKTQETTGTSYSCSAFVTRIRCRQPRIGTRKLHYLLNTQADKTLNIGRDRLFNLLDEYRLLVPVKRAYHKTTNSHHRYYRHPNLLKPSPGQVTALEPEQVWVSDITYLPLRSGTSYLSLVTDACSRKIVGYHVWENLQTWRRPGKW